MDTTYNLNNLANCCRCPRLTQWRLTLNAQDSGYVSHPIGSWGDPRPQVLVIGLAPGPQGAARSGKAFVGDDSGRFLFQSLHRYGFATSPRPDEAALNNLRISNVVKCLPPKNLPTVEEQNNCLGYLKLELAKYCPKNARMPRVIVSLGGVAHRRVCVALGIKSTGFAHGAQVRVGPRVTLISSFHPSRLNVNTGRLTPAMLHNIFQRCRQLVASPTG